MSLYIYIYIFAYIHIQSPTPTRMKREVVTCESYASTETQIKQVVSSVDHPPLDLFVTFCT